MVDLDLVGLDALEMLQVGGVVLALQEFFPSLQAMPARAITAYAVAASVSLLVFRGHYSLIEKASLLMIGGFTLFTLASICVLQTTDLAISGGEFVSGLIPNLPAETAILLVAIGAFGITGVGAFGITGVGGD
ncbi:MAG: hypothetical protein P8L85_22435 [Rubripirellula sp.]|nr:hypothetical protein [Rubripirellula sp.]